MEETNINKIYTKNTMLQLNKPLIKEKIEDYILSNHYSDYNIKIKDPEISEYIFNVETQYDIEPCIYNDNSTKKYNGYEFELIIKREEKQRINECIKSLYDDGYYTIDDFEDCLDNRIKNYNCLSFNKIFNKIWNEAEIKYGLFNDGIIELNKYMLIKVNWSSSTFDSKIGEQYLI